MITLNPFVENNKARINQFLNNLCEVPDFYDTLEVRPSLEQFGRVFTVWHRWINTWRYRRRIFSSILL